MEIKKCCRCGTRVASFTMLMVTMIAPLVQAGENGASVYPIGVETVMPGMTPPPHGTMLYEYTAFVSANQVDDQNGNAVPVEFRLRVFANAIKVNHNWGVHILGGTLESNIAIPFIDQQLHVIPGLFSKFAVGNVAISPLGLAYARGHVHFYYEGDLFFPGTGHSSTDVLNIGQNNYAAGPVGGITYLAGKEEISSKLQYLFNLEDVPTQYKSGQEFLWEFDGMHAIHRKVAVGVNGYLYKQTTNDLMNNLVYNNGNRGRDLGIGPEVRFNLIAHGGFAVKYLHDTLVENKPPTNAFWFQLAVPITVGHRE